SVQIIIGETPQRIGVVTTTSLGEDFCGYENQEILWTDTIFPLPGPILLGFSEFPDDGLCAEGPVWFTVELAAGSIEADGFDFIFFKHRRGSDTIDTLEFFTEYNSVLFDDGVHFTQDGRFDSITVEVRAVNDFCTPPRRGNPITGTFKVFNSPRISIFGDTLPCIETSQIYEIVLSDPHVTFDFNYIAPPGVTVDASGLPHTVEVDFFGDSVQFIFSNISHNFCDFLPIQQIFTIVTDTAPTIFFDVTVFRAGESIDFACMGDTLMFVAETTQDYDFDVDFIWSLPSLTGEMTMPWRLSHFLGEGRDTAFLVSAEYIDLTRSRFDTITVFARGSCGISQIPQLAIVELGVPPSFDVNILSDILPGDTVCEGTELTVWADISDLTLNIHSIRWNYLGISIEVEGNDTFRFATPRGDFMLNAQFFAQGACGFSDQISSIQFNVHNLPGIPQRAQVPFPCGDTVFSMNIVHDPWTDSLSWQPDFFTPLFEIHRSYGSRVDDSLYFPRIGMTPFTLTVAAYNYCSKLLNITIQNTILITPSAEIEPFPTDVFYNLYIARFCRGDIIEIDINVPIQHTNTRPNYIWALPRDWQIVRDSFVENEPIKRIWLIPGTESGIIELMADAGACGSTALIESDSLHPTILRLITSQSTDTAQYADTDVRFFIGDVGIVSGAGINDNQGVGDFDIFWNPSERFSVSADGGTANLDFAFMTTEEFEVTAVERFVSQGQACAITDTLYLYVENNYVIEVTFPEIVCRYTDFRLVVNHTGGEPRTGYTQQWFSIVDGNYVRIPSTNETITETIAGTADSAKFMVVGMNQLFTDPSGEVTWLISDTSRFAVAVVAPIVARIDR
ncbi:MAG: hypothetical protein FWC98_05670, partial [Bacteroidales bacterium]|nr:hypothetical protein [Bacteroidales bacterium]